MVPAKYTIDIPVGPGKDPPIRYCFEHNPHHPHLQQHHPPSWQFPSLRKGAQGPARPPRATGGLHKSQRRGCKSYKLGFSYCCIIVPQLFCMVPRDPHHPPGGHLGDFALKTRMLNLGGGLWPVATEGTRSRSQGMTPFVRTPEQQNSMMVCAKFHKGVVISSGITKTTVPLLCYMVFVQVRL